MSAQEFFIYSCLAAVVLLLITILAFNLNWEVVGFTSLIGLGVVFFIGVLGGANNWWNSHSCEVWANRNGYEYSYRFFGDECQVKIDGQWYSDENVIINKQKSAE